MNLKDRLTSTENLLRSIRSGEAFASSAKGKAAAPQTPGSEAQQSIWTRRISLGDVFAGLVGRDKGKNAPPSPQPSPSPKISAQPEAPRKAAAAPPAAPPQAPAAPAQQPPVSQTPTGASPLITVIPGRPDAAARLQPQHTPTQQAKPAPGRAAQARPEPPVRQQAAQQPPVPSVQAAQAERPAAKPASKAPEAPSEKTFEPPQDKPLGGPFEMPLDEQLDAPHAAPAAKPPVSSGQPQQPRQAPAPQAPEMPYEAPGLTIVAARTNASRSGMEAVAPPAAPASARVVASGPRRGSPAASAPAAAAAASIATSAKAPATAQAVAQAGAQAAQGSIWTRPISLGDAVSGLFGRKKTRQAPEQFAPPASATARAATAHNPASPLVAGAAAPQVPPAAAAPAAYTKSAPAEPFWKRQISFGRSAKAFRIGVSISGTTLCLGVLRNGSNAIAAVKRVPLNPGQNPGESGFPALLRASLQSLALPAGSAELWMVLRSAELDLNVLSVPRLSGAKLDAAVYWTLQKEKKFAEAEYVLDYLILGPTPEAKEPRLDALTCLARRAEVDRLRDAFREAGHPLDGITAIPNAFLSLYRLPGAPKGHGMAANIHVEPEFSAIGLYTQDRLVFSRFIRSGAGSMAEALVEHFQKLAKPKAMPLGDLELPLPGAASRPMSGASGQQPQIAPLDLAQAQALMRHVLLDAPRPAFATPTHLLSQEEMLEILAPPIERLARQVERTLDYYASTTQARCDILHLSGEIFTSEDIQQALSAQLAVPHAAFDATRIVNGGAALVQPLDRMAMAPSLAAALSVAGRGINLLHNYKVRTTAESKRKVTSGLVLGLAAVLTVIGGAGVVLDRANTAKQNELRGVRAQLASLGPAMDEGALSAAVGQFKLRQGALREAAVRLLAPAVLNELTLRAPENVKIISVTVNYPEPEAPKPASAPGQPAPPPPAPGAAAAAKPQGTIAIEGVVTGSKVDFDANLSRFVLSMQGSPMFHLPVVDESGLRELGNSGQVLHFVMHVGVK